MIFRWGEKGLGLERFYDILFLWDLVREGVRGFQWF
jgi:hypothetical protein